MPPKFNRGLDEQMLEGGVGGMGGASGRYTSSGKKSFDATKDAADTIVKGLGIPLLTAGAGVGIKKLNEQQNAYDEVRKKEAESADTKKEKNAEGKKAGGVIRSASKRADGIATKGKTRGKMI